MAREKFKRTIQPGEIKPGDIIYGLDEMGLVLAYYGKDSAIYEAMASGKSISKMVEQSVEAHKGFLEKEAKLLKMLKEREKLVEESQAEEKNQ